MKTTWEELTYATNEWQNAKEKLKELGKKRTKLLREWIKKAGL